MKNFTTPFKGLLLTAIGTFMLFSCELEEINVNPNVPVDVPMSTLLPSAQKNLADVLGGRLFRYVGIFSQQLQGESNQELLFEFYNPDELFVGYAWDDMYGGPMINLKIIIEKAEASDSPHYSGIAKIMMANCLGTLTDIWGSVPYTEALQGADNTTPAYDEQEAIYGTILTLLDEGIAECQAGNSVLSPISDDIIYNGNMGAWVRAGYALKARYWIHQTGVNAGAAGFAMEAANNGLVSENDDLLFPFLGSGDRNPIFVFFDQTANAIVDPQYLSVLGSQDLRFDFFVDLIPFTGGQSKVGDALGRSDAPIWMMSYVEQEFIRAEAYLRQEETLNAQNAMQDAIRASVRQHTDGAYTEEEIEAFVAEHTLTGDFEADLEIVMREKFAALFTQVEPWSDWRRTGYPELDPNDGGSNAANPGGAIPRRMVYPQNERLLNPNIPSPLPTMQDSFWWDTE